MLPVLLFVTIGYLCYYVYCLLSNIRLARSIGLPYLVVPFHVYSVFWVLGGVRLYPLLEKLPFIPRLRWVRPDWFWYRKYDMYREVKSDTFFLVSASGLLLLSSDADVTQDILNRKDDFPKPPQVHPALDIFGRNVVTANGAEWKKHRRIITSHFSENYNKLAWTKALEKTNLLVETWRSHIPGELRGPRITTTADDFMRLTLHITFFNMFGLHLRWPNRLWTTPHKPSELPPTDEEIPAGHTMTFQSCLHHWLEYCVVVLVSPAWYLKYSPIKAHRQAGEAHREMDLYLKEMIKEKQIEQESGNKGNDLISALLRARETGEKSARGEHGISEQEVIGNLFMLVFTGHATTANTLHYTTMMMALYPEYQMKLQEDLDRILGDREPDYERDYHRLVEGWAGAIFYEILRLYPSLPNVPKYTYSPQYIKVDGGRYLIPQDTHVHLNTTNTHRNPKYWVPPHQSEHEAAPNEFRPQRWFAENPTGFQKQDSTNPKHEDTPAPQTFFNPYPGSYFPWSAGQRVCLGKKYSIVELMAVYIVIFREWSVELDVQEGETLADAWRRAKKYIDGVDLVLALKPKGREPGIRYVRRGEEKYFPPRK